jgi:hypothetical protein
MRVEAGNVIGFVRLGAIEALVVFRFISSQCVAPFEFAGLEVAGPVGSGFQSLGALNHLAR